VRVFCLLHLCAPALRAIFEACRKLQQEIAMKIHPPLKHGPAFARFFMLFFFSLLVLQLTVADRAAADPDEICINEEHRTFSLYIENDVFAGDDGQYTNGVKLSWSRYGLSELPEDAWLHKWLYPVIKGIGFDKPASVEKALTFSIGQNIYTPEDIEKRELIEDDRPYAGITYAELGFHRRKFKYMHTLALMVGIVGPDSYAEDVQSKTHEWLNSNDPKGWDNQLENEPVLGLVYDYKNRLFNKDNGGLGSDVILSAGSTVGNIRVCASTGLLARWGWNIPNDFGNFPIQSATCFNAEVEESYCGKQVRKFGLHLFISANAKAVAHDIFLDGNTWRDSHSVDKKPFVGTFMGGIGLNSKRFKAVLSYVYQTKAFDEQDDPQVYGSLNLSFRF
jgi:hypothetical protein